MSYWIIKVNSLSIFFIHLTLCLASATHNFKWKKVKIGWHMVPKGKTEEFDVFWDM